MFKFPLAVEIDLTNSCNYNCLYCRNGMLNKKEYIDYDDVKKIILKLLHHYQIKNDDYKLSLLTKNKNLYRVE